MKNKKPAKRNEKGKAPRKVSVIAIIVALLLIGSGLGVTHIGLASKYKDYTNPLPRWCDVCHKKPVSHDQQWITNHGNTALFYREYCTSCHQPNVCKDCHKHRPPSHDSNWLQSTHIMVAKGSRKGCYECHIDDFCINCHQSNKQ